MVTIVISIAVIRLRVMFMARFSERLRQSKCGDHDVDGLDPDEGHDDAADAIDQQVAPEERGGALGPVLIPRSASGTSATMTSALKITADRIADSGVADP